MSEGALWVDGLTVCVDERPVLDGVGLVAGTGEIVAVTGRSGGGKSTLLRALAGHLAPGLRKTAGRVSVGGIDPFALDGARLRRLRRDHVAVVGQDPMSSFQPRHRVRTILGEACPRAGDDELVAAVELARLGASVLDRRPGELSGGELRRVALARALVRRPSVLALDEPTSGIDPQTAERVLGLLRSLADECGVTLVVATHDATIARRVADRCVALDAGRVRPAGAGPRRQLVLGGRAVRRVRRDGLVLEAAGLRVQAGHGRHAVDLVRGVDLALARGQVLGVVGPSGAGKTSLLRLLAGLARGEGEVRLAGEPLALDVRARPLAQRAALQYVPQDPLGALNPARTTASTLGRPLGRFQGLGRRDARAAAVRLLAEVELDGALLGRRPHELSGGQRQRVALARALAARPSVVLCDEITSALDDRSAAAVLTTLLRARDRHGLALLLVTHDHELARAVADEVLVVDGGRVIARGAPGAVLAPSPPPGRLEAVLP